MMVVMIRYWFFAAFVITIATRKEGSLRAAAATTQPVLQITRGLLLAGEICVMVAGFVLLGLVESHAIFACYPLLVAAFSGPILGEKVGWRRWAAIAVGFIGVLVILRPGFAVFSPYAVIPLASAVMFAIYSLLTRYASRRDSAATSFFWTGVTGSVAMTAVGLWYWEPMTGPDWIMDVRTLRDGGNGALPAHQNLRSRRGLRCATLRLFPTAVRRVDRDHRVRRRRLPPTSPSVPRSLWPRASSHS